MFFKVKMSVYMDFWTNSVFSGVIMDEFSLLHIQRVISISFHVILQSSKRVKLVIMIRNNLCVKIKEHDDFLIQLNSLKS